MRNAIAFGLLLGCLGMAAVAWAADVSVTGEPASTAAKRQGDDALRDPSYPASRIAWLQLPAPDTAAIAALKRGNAESGYKRLQVGLERPVAANGERYAPDLHWQPSADGGLVARFAVESTGAEALRLALQVRGLADAAEVRVSDRDGEHAATDASLGAEVMQRVRADGVFWTPVSTGAVQQVELYVPAGTDTQWIRVEVERVAHLLVPPTGRIDMAKIGESDYCESDTICVSNPTAAFTTAKKSVARMLYQDGGTYVCTGTLLNDTDSSTQIPWFYSAAHCMSSQSVANTLVTYWNYETTSCGGSTVSSSAQQVSGGAQLTYVNEGSDVLLLKLNNAPPAGSYYLGWTSAQIATGTDITVIHHPAGDVKKVSFGKVKSLGPSDLASGSFIQAGYSSGTTEGGSSGSGLLSLGSEYQLRGGLLGGSAGCSNSGNINTTANSDDYSRFDLAFSSLRTYLSPTSTPPTDNNDYSGAWYNASQSGWGVNVVKGSSGAYGIFIYHYDSSNRPIWYLAAGPLSGSTFSQPVLKFSGPWFGTVPFNPAQVSTLSVGTLSITFTSTTSATLSFTIDGRTVTSAITRLDF